MTTKVKSEYWAEEVRSYDLYQLENGDVIKAMISEYESLLLPCLHCGKEHPVIG